MKGKIWVKSAFLLVVGFVLLSVGCEESSDGSGESIDANTESEAVEEDAVVPSATKDICAPCTDAAECLGEDAACIQYEGLGSICTTSCVLSLNNCAPGYYCGLTGNTSADFHCLPKYGACVGEGGSCSPCGNGEPCNEGYVCHQSSLDLAESCFMKCSADEDCAAPGSTGEKCINDICIPVYEGANRDICNEGNRNLCEPCAYDFDCAEGLSCIGSYCTVPCEDFGGTSNTCPEGMFCPKGFCEPPPAYKCQGWFGCSFGCNELNKEVCVAGFCKIPCVGDSDCPFGVTFDGTSGYCNVED